MAWGGHLGMWGKLKAMLRSRVTWTGMAFLFVKFPVGIATLSLVGAVVYVSGVFTTAFIYYDNVRISLVGWEIDNLGSAFVLLPIWLVGLALLPHIINALAWASGAMARAMLSLK